MTMGSGALAGIRVVEFAGLGPAPFAGMMLADMGADVIVIDRLDNRSRERADEHRGKRSIQLDLKHARGQEVAWALLERADALIEGFRPGVMERLGFGPDAVAARNPRLVFGRVTGWGQDGPLAQAAGHDINYVCLTGAMTLAARPGQAPMVPATLVGDMGGGGASFGGGGGRFSGGGGGGLISSMILVSIGFLMTSTTLRAKPLTRAQPSSRCIKITIPMPSMCLPGLRCCSA
jgi:crotonobetainyl-CoA:carnitine CoA-transferase CaiB-like acyl-CoA transferase